MKFFLIISIFHIFIFYLSTLAQAIDSKHVDIWSDGTRMSGDIHYPNNYNEDKKMPAILMTQGWGGIRADLNKYFKIIAGYCGVVTVF